MIKVSHNKRKVDIGEPVLTRYERARIVGARALQISHGAPVLINTEHDDFRPIDVAERELRNRVLPIGLSRRLPNGKSQVIPIQYLKDREFIGQIETEMMEEEEEEVSQATTVEKDDLTIITGIGESSLDHFYDAGFYTVASIANATTKELSKVSGVGQKTAEDFIDKAKKLTSGALDEDLTRIRGIGENNIDDFTSAGFEKISDIANASVKDLSKISGVGSKTAENLIEEAKRLDLS